MPGLRTCALATLAAFPLATAAQTALVSPNSEPDGRFGEAVSSLGRLGGDTVRDVLVGAPGETVDGQAAAGRAYAVSGADGSALLTLVSPTPTENGRFGATVASAGDVNGDGLPDAIVGAPGETAGGELKAGRAHVFSGADGAVLYSLESPTPWGVGLFGASIARIEDVDDDGISDIVIGAPQERGDAANPAPANAGAYHVFSGATGARLRSATFTQAEARMGGSVAALDLDRDGTPEILASVAGWDEGAAEDVGGVSIDGSAPPFLLPPARSRNASLGQSLDVVGDRDGDGIGEIVTSALDSVYVFSGGTGALLFSVGSQAGSGGGFGWSVSGAGNVDERGAADLIIGAISEQARGIDNAGRIYIISGTDGAILRSVTSPNAEPLGQFGFDVALAGEVDEDVTADQIVGAPGENGGAGRAYLLLSQTVVSNEAAPSGGLALSASPNPARGTLRLGSAAGSTGTLTVTDALGREVWAREVHGATTLDVSTWAPGVYLARLVSRDGTATRAITVTR